MTRALRREGEAVVHIEVVVVVGVEPVVGQFDQFFNRTAAVDDFVQVPPDPVEPFSLTAVSQWIAFR